MPQPHSVVPPQVERPTEERPDPLLAWTRTMVGGDAGLPERCPHCGSDRWHRWGRSGAGVARRRCRSCARSFSARTGTAWSGVRELEKFMAVVAAMLDEAPASCRELARRFQLDKMTVWQWRRKITTALLDPGLPPRPVLAELQAEPVRESRKASREWVRHRQDPCRFPAPNRPRWVDVDHHGLQLPLPLAAYQCRVLVDLDRSGCRPVLMPVVAKSVFGACFDPERPIERHRQPGDHMAEPAMPRGSATEDRCAEAITASALSAAPDAAAGGTLLARLGMASAAALEAAFTCFMRPFCGPAVGHLRAYVAWFIARHDRHLPGGIERLRARLAPAQPTLNQDMAA